MDDRLYKILMRVAIVLTIAWIGWTLYDSGLNPSAPGAHELAAARKQLEDGRFNEALASFSGVYSMDSENLGALRGQAQALMQMGMKETQQSGQRRQAGMGREAVELEESAAYHYRQALAHYDEAIVREQQRAPSELRQRILGVAHANRGILKDHMGDYHGALSDYEESMQLEPEVKEGPGLLTRFMRNQAEKPPTIADRVKYLKAELAKPESERLLNLPEEDAGQRAYTMD